MSPKNYLLFIIPALQILFGVLFFNQIFPIYSAPVGYGADTAYVYLISGFSLLQGNNIGFFDHPGIPLHLLSAIAIICKFFLFNYQSQNFNAEVLVNDFVSNTELYAQFLCMILLVLNTCVVYAIGRATFSSTSNIFISMLSQCCLLGVGSSLSLRIGHIGPEAMLLFFSALIIYMMTEELYIPKKNNKDDLSKNLKPILIGLVLAMGVSTKVIFLPVLAITLLFKETKIFLISICSFFIFYALLLLLLGKKVFSYFEGFISLVTHSGFHGTGSREFINLDAIIPGLRLLYTSFPLFFVSIALLMTTLICVLFTKKLRVKQLEISHRSLITLLTIMILQTLIVLKAPRIHYMVPALPFGIISISLLLHYLWMPVKKLYGICLIKLLTFSLILLILFSNIDYYRGLKIERASISSHLKEINLELSLQKNPLIIGTYMCRSLVCAQHFGTTFVPSAYPYFKRNFENFAAYHDGLHKVNIGRGWENLDVVSNQLNAGRSVFILTPSPNDELNVFQFEGDPKAKHDSLLRVIRVN